MFYDSDKNHNSYFLSSYSGFGFIQTAVSSDNYR